MKRTSFLKYFAAGILWMNSVPHFAIGITGRRNLTPFGRNSSAAVNILWACINSIGGWLLLQSADKKEGIKAGSDSWLVACIAGSLSMGVFMLTYEAAKKHEVDIESV